MKAHYVEYLPHGSESLVLPVRFVTHDEQSAKWLLQPARHREDPVTLRTNPGLNTALVPIKSNLQVGPEQTVVAVGREIELLARIARLGKRLELADECGFFVTTVPRSDVDEWITANFLDPLLRGFDELALPTRPRGNFSPFARTLASILGSNARVDPMERAVRQRYLAAMTFDEDSLQAIDLRAQLLDGLDIEELQSSMVDYGVNQYVPKTYTYQDDIMAMVSFASAVDLMTHSSRDVRRQGEHSLLRLVNDGDQIDTRQVAVNLACRQIERGDRTHERVHFLEELLPPAPPVATSMTKGVEVHLQSTTIGGLNLGGRHVGKLHLDRASIGGELVLDGAVLTDGLWLTGATIAGDLAMSQARIVKQARFDRAVIKGQAAIADTTFENEATFRRTVFNGNANFSGSLFLGRTKFNETDFRGRTDFSEATFLGKPQWDAMQTAQAVDIDRAIISDGDDRALRQVVKTQGRRAGPIDPDAVYETIEITRPLKSPDRLLLKAIHEPPPTHWPREGFVELLRRLDQSGRGDRARVIVTAALSGGFLPRNRVYGEAGLQDDRTLGRFSIPATQVWLALIDEGEVDEFTRPPLIATHEGGSNANGYVVPSEFVPWARDLYERFPQILTLGRTTGTVELLRGEGLSLTEHHPDQAAVDGPSL